jgi:hypothetical protein
MLSVMEYPHWMIVSGAILVRLDLSVLHFAKTGTPVGKISLARTLGLMNTRWPA